MSLNVTFNDKQTRSIDRMAGELGLSDVEVIRKACLLLQCVLKTREKDNELCLIKKNGENGITVVAKINY